MINEETKKYGTDITELERKLRGIGVQLTYLRCEPGCPTEIQGIIEPSPVPIKPPKKKVNKPTPRKVIFSGPATTILWTDGTKTTVKCQGDEVFDKEKGVALCYLKKMLGNKGNYNNIFREVKKLMKEDSHDN